MPIPGREEEYADIFVFYFGSLVIWNSTLQEEKFIQEELLKFAGTQSPESQPTNEVIKCKYNPEAGKRSQYVPDFLVFYQDKNGKRKAEIVEVKPKKEAMLEHAKSKRDKAFLLVNSASRSRYWRSISYLRKRITCSAVSN